MTGLAFNGVAGGHAGHAEHDLPPTQALFGSCGHVCNAGKVREKRLPTNVFKMAEATSCIKWYKHAEKQFIEESYVNRVFPCRF